VDYGPDLILKGALEAAGLPVGAAGPLPLKTCMWIDPGSVKVGLGYNAEPVELELAQP